ncbi:MAG TPA: site-specific integrase [Streptosporangiaceae bacterium]
MTTTISSPAALAVIEPAFTEAERLTLAGFLAGYSGLTREAYALDLRQFTAWCRQQQLRLFTVRRADIELFARDLEAAGRTGATVTRRLSTIAGLYKYAVEEDLLDHSPAVRVRRPRIDYESRATGLDRNEVGALLVAAGLGTAAEHRWSRCSHSTGCACPRPPALTSKPWGPNEGTVPWRSPARAARKPSSRSPRGPRGDRPGHRQPLRRTDLHHRRRGAPPSTQASR